MVNTNETNGNNVQPPNSAQQKFCPWRRDSTVSLAIRNYAQGLEGTTQDKDETAGNVSDTDIESAIDAHAKDGNGSIENNIEKQGGTSIKNDDSGGMMTDSLEPRSAHAAVSPGSIDDWDDHCCHLICQLEVYADYIAEARLRVLDLVEELRSDDATWEGDQSSRVEFLKRFLDGIHFDDNHIVFDEKLWFQLKSQASRSAKEPNTGLSRS